MQRDYELKAEYIDGGVTINVKHPGGEYVKKFDNIRQELFNKFIVQTKHIQTGYDETKYRLYWETEHGFKLLLVIFDIENLATDTIEESFVKVYFTNNNIAIETSLIPHTSSPTTNPNKEVAMQKDYKIDAEYICDRITISVKNNGGEYIETINNIREYTSPDNIEYIQTENGFEKRMYDLVRDTKHGFHFVIKIHDLVNKATGDISKSYLKVDLITDDYQKITTPFIPREEPQMGENQDKYHDGGSFADDENFQEEPIGPDTGSNGDLASLEAKIHELTELVLNQHRVITHMSDMMSILHDDLMRHMSHHPATPHHPNFFVPPEFGRHIPQQPTQPKKETATMQSTNQHEKEKHMDPKNQQEKVKPVPTVKVKMNGEITVHGELITTITNNLNNKTNRINWYTNGVQIINSPLFHIGIFTPEYRPAYPIIANKPNGIDSYNQELKCVCANVMLSIYNGRLTDAKVFLAMTGEKFFRKLVGFITIGDETIVMPEVPLTPIMIAEIQILQTLLTTLTDQPELELPDMETKTPCFTSLTPNPIPQPIFNPYGPHPSQQFNQQPSFNPFNPHPSFGPTPYPPQQPPVGYYPPSGMGQGLHPNPSHQPAHSVVFTGPEVGAQYTTNNSVLGQMNGLNQRVNTQQQPNATKEEIKDQAAFWSNFLK